MDKTDPESQAAGNGTGTNVVPMNAPEPQQRPSEKIVSFVKRHPVLAVAGAVVAGAAVSALLPRRATRRIAGKAMTLAEAAGATTAMLGREAGDKAQQLGRDARRKAHDLGERAEDAGHAATHKLEKIGLAALSAAAALGRATAERAGHVGEAAGEKSRKVITLADNLRSRLRH